MTCKHLTLCCCGLLLVAGCDEGSGESEQGRPMSGSADRREAVLRHVRDFMELPLEGTDEDGDLRAYRHVCEKAEAVAGEIWRLSGDPDEVIDFWTVQRNRFDAEAERCEALSRQATEAERAMAQGCREGRRFHNRRCLYLYPLVMSDEHVLMEVVSNKFFSADRAEFDRSMAHLRKVIGRNFGYDEQLRLLYQNRK